MSGEFSDKYKSIVHSHQAIALEDEGTHFEALAKPSTETDFWEETALGVVGESGENDVLLWAAGYVLAANGQGIWGEGITAEREIQLIVVPKSQRGTMSDNNFLRVGWTPSERMSLDKLKVTAGDDSVTWDFNGLQFVAAPPRWALQGSAGGAQFDLSYEQKGTPLWNWGPFADAAKGDRAGYDVFVDVNGTITTPEMTLELTRGYGVREHIITGQSNDPVKNLPAPNWMWWLYSIEGDVKVNFFQINDAMQIGFVKYGEQEQVNFGTHGGPDQSIAFKVTEKWEDPRTGMNLPVKWRLDMDNSGCKVAVDIAAHGRAYSHWPTAHGTRMYCYLLSTMTGTVELPDGRVIELKEHLTVNSFCRTVLTAGETLAGAAPKRPG
ncbi:hypothetical protein M9978_12655 [Sphingomonas sp. MG17]|uniref:Uncharacterized protein n=1 Tax=Sphingomonas tagetis TaxID=2949092 RepID=A0A9X2KQ20_9SPHN|nr:hypothetical protein [Sphingomonas tagetis]MCP3731278.1 hypothetical protein [Sphingomonas tagetis]